MGHPPLLVCRCFDSKKTVRAPMQKRGGVAAPLAYLYGSCLLPLPSPPVDALHGAGTPCAAVTARCRYSAQAGEAEIGDEHRS